MITPADVRDFAVDMGFDFSDVGDTTLNKFISLAYERLERETGKIVQEKEVTETIPRVRFKMTVSHPIKEIKSLKLIPAHIPIGLDLPPDIAKHDPELGIVRLFPFWKDPATYEITYIAKSEVDENLVDTIALKMVFLQVLRSGKFVYLFTKFPGEIKEGDVTVSYLIKFYHVDIFENLEREIRESVETIKKVPLSLI